MAQSDKVSSILKWIDEACKLVSNHGLWKIFKAMFVIAFGVFFIGLALNPRYVFEKFTEYTREEEQQNIEYRKNASVYIQNALKGFVDNTGALRACVLEFHNGRENPGHLGFYYAEMTYEETRKGAVKTNRMYKEVSLSLFNISDIVYENGFWYGTIDGDLAAIDPGLAEMMKTSGTEWAATMLLEGSDELGLLVVSFDWIPSDPQAIGREVRKVGALVAGMLDYESYEKGR